MPKPLCNNCGLVACPVGRGCAPLAHAWLEQRTHTPLVPCSTHGGGTTPHSQHSPTYGLFPIIGGRALINIRKLTHIFIERVRCLQAHEILKGLDEVRVFTLSSAY